MSAIRGQSPISKPDLFARLAEGHAARITVVTPNRRLSQALMADFDAWQAGKGRAAWEAPDILPFDAYVQRLWEEALYSEHELPLLLTASQEQVIWEEVLRGSNLLSISETAAQCRDAWRLAHAWRIGLEGGGEDAQAFREWAKSYEARTRAEVDAARLPDVVLEFISKSQRQALLVAYAFDIVPPQTREFLSAFTVAECHPERSGGRTTRTSFASARQELERAATWARARLEEGASRIGVVVPDLAKRRKEVLRVFSRMMQPGYNVPATASTEAAAKSALPFNVSLGTPLTQVPLVHAALGLIRLSSQELEFAAVSRLIRSPFLGGAETELTRRARLEADLRDTLDATVSLAALVASAGRCALLRQHLEAVFALKKEGKDSPASWARHFSALLDAAGFPGERTLDSAEFQAQAKWHESLGELARLDRISRPVSMQEAYSTLQRLCRDTLFQPESPPAPIQILGVLESSGLRFECLWVSGLTDEAWPMEARPNPFIPVALQKKAGVPQASPEGSAALDRRLTEEWLGAAAEVIVSSPEKEQDRDLAPSPLIVHIAEGALELPEFPRYRDLLFSKRNLVTVKDPSGPPVPPGPVRGGTRVLADQAACPFRAFARHRLAAERLEAPLAGPDASDRGRLLHGLMKHLWSELKGSSNLHGTNVVPVIERAAAAAVKEAGIEGRFAELERMRLARLADEWLEVEKKRKSFEVVAVEEKRTLRIAELDFEGRIDRMDRLLEGEGGHVLIDYKTGYRVTPKDWDPPRPDDPQLPLYAVAAPEALSAVAFAKVRPGAMRFMGLGKTKDLVPNVRAAKNWPALLADWNTETESLGAAFAAGAAAVDPKRDLKTCERCDLQTLCRVYEKFNVLEEIEDDEEKW